MAEEILIGIGLAMIFVLPSILIIEGAQKNLAEEEKKIVTLRLNTLLTLFEGSMSMLYTFIGLALIYISLDFPFLLTIIIPFAVIFLIDFPVFLNHLIQVKSQSVVIDKENETVLIKKAGKEIIINLNNDEYEVIRYEPRWLGNSNRKPPGVGLGKIVVLKDNNRAELSDLLLNNYDLFSLLKEKEDRSVISRYFIFIK